MSRRIPWAETPRQVMLLVSKAAVNRFGANKASRHMRVRVYWNLHHKCWSVQYQGRVLCHARSVELWNAWGSVSQAGRRRVLREQRKNVHAFIVGDACQVDDHMRWGEPERVFYNPYKFEEFQVGDPNGDHRVFNHAQVVKMLPTREVKAFAQCEGSVNSFDAESKA